MAGVTGEKEADIAQMTLDMLAELPLAVSVAKDGPDALRQTQARCRTPCCWRRAGDARPFGAPQDQWAGRSACQFFVITNLKEVDFPMSLP